MKKLYTLLVVALLIGRGFAQTAPLTGKVVDESGRPLQGVSVGIKGKAASAVTNPAGSFSIRAALTDSLVFSFVGYRAQTVAAGSDLMVHLGAEVGSLNDLVVVGYSTTKKANLTGAVAQVGSEVLENRPLTNLTQGLEGTIPNLNIIPADGKPNSSANYNIRGTTSIGQGGSALVLIDGVEGDPALINPNDVATVTVLKDAGSAAIYGARAAFGVVLITTKVPTKGRATVNYSSSYSSKSPTVVPDVVDNGYQWLSLFNTAFSSWNDGAVAQNINKTQPFSLAYLAEAKNRDANPSLPKVEVGPAGNYVYYGNTNWYNLLYKDHNFATDQNLSISGSTDKASYLVSGHYNGQSGIFRYNSDDYSVYNVRGKGTVDVTSWLQIYNNTEYSVRKYHNPLNIGEGGGIWRNIADEGHPSSMLLNPDGTLTWSAGYTVGDFYYGKNGITTTDKVFKNTAGFSTRFFNNTFRIKGDLTFQNTNNNGQQIRVQVPYSQTPNVISYLGTTTNDLLEYRRQSQYTAANIFGEYERRFGDHYFKLLAGYNYEQAIIDSVGTQRNGLVYNSATNINLALGTNITTAGRYEMWAILGGFGRLNYSYKDRYLVEFDARYDGSSKFPANERYGFFPSVSAGWRVSKEAFWHADPKLITDLKIRGSYGSLGNGSIASYAFQEQFGISQLGRIINGARPQYTSAPGVLPAGLTWETSTTKDLGLDLSMLSGRLTLSGDIYRRATTNMFTVGPTLPAVFGATVPKGNYADLNTDGWEATITWHDGFKIAGKQGHYNIGVWMSDYHATITRYNNANSKLTDFYVGQPYGAIYGYTNDGYWTKDNVAQAFTSQTLFKSTNTGQWQPGDIKFKDLNKDGVINNGDNTATNPGDMSIIGNSLPRYNYGFTLGGDWNGIFVSAFFQGVGHQDWWPGTEADNFWGTYNRPYNQAFKSQVSNEWSPDNPNAYWPRLSGYVAQNGAGELAVAQTAYLQNVAYLRLKSIQLGYNLPISLISRIRMTNARIYVSGENLVTWTPFYKVSKNMDVENIGKSDVTLTGTSNNGNGNNYPILKSVTVGLNVTF